MSICIEPTVAEKLRLLAGGKDLPWAELYERLEKKASAKLQALGEWERNFLDYSELESIILNEGRRRGIKSTLGRSYLRARYIALRLDGVGHKLAEMFATQTPPMSNTDREFLEGHCNGNQFEGMPEMGDLYARRAKEAGVDITGKVYIHGLADSQGDPKAWVSGRGDVERVIRERNWSCEGSLNIKGREVEGSPDIRVADDLVHSRMIDRLEENPALALKGHDELFHETREQIQPHWTD